MTAGGVVPGDPSKKLCGGALEDIRRRFAADILSAANIRNPALQAAVASIPRERFLGDPPWQIVGMGDGYKALPSFDPAVAYQDVLFALPPDRGVNNGSPSLHAVLLHSLDARPGHRVLHIGAGTGYYTAILAALVGADGRVLAVEIDPALCAQAKANLVGLPAVEVQCADGAAWPSDPVDRIYVSFEVSRPAAPWIEGLAMGGRLILPLGVAARRRGGRLVDDQNGVVFLIERGIGGFAAQAVTRASFVHAAGAMEAPAREDALLRRALNRGGARLVRSLIWKHLAATDRCWFHSRGWSLSQDPVAEG